MKYTIHPEAAAPAQSCHLRAKTKEHFGFILNLLGELSLAGIVSETSLTPKEQQILALSNPAYPRLRLGTQFTGTEPQSAA